MTDCSCSDLSVQHIEGMSLLLGSCMECAPDTGNMSVEGKDAIAKLVF